LRKPGIILNVANPPIRMPTIRAKIISRFTF